MTTTPHPPSPSPVPDPTTPPVPPPLPKESKFQRFTNSKPVTALKGQGKELWDSVKSPGWIRSVGLMVLGILVYNGTNYQWLGELLSWGGVGLGIYDLWTTKKKIFPGNKDAWISWLGQWIAILVLLILFWQSAHIYTAMARAIFPDQSIIQFGDLGAEAVSKLPLIGWMVASVLKVVAAMLKSMEMTAVGTLAVICYGYIQYAEVAPILLKGDIRIMDRLIDSLSQQQYVNTASNDPKVVKDLAEERNEFYDSYLEDIKNRQLWAYIVDAFVCAIYAPIFVGGYTNVVWNAIRFAFGLNLLDWANIMRVGISLFGFAFVVKRFVKIRREYLLLSGKIIS
ncbi:hypothetical protein [Leptothoe spongobia]|uniref:Uncharacterized protein n=1 Tax=Leptothoe spongobia TAU-MAC 1115 TaxID=1967444 RepID=A0A947DFQ9_9CYAN|nr:hypothetical protein [Leptothoe spongobia]MBT9316267.1 hypothetical protein [Leptothoe spongobia TAU-MAC 1115]